ncbi:hypothetical protein D9619_009108 [Psilocybe cf. subviscida]|uniref:Uncharacterized protein n=1 Tax=Psilocybe cf. subviscida TaxID=2480587 RepID=A0A8H5BW48_9AGAR|nr:hypothetical protein D9619_009108 [Psilocybe cf. subviscida]
MEATAHPTESQEAIVSNANYHTRLLQTISDLEYVPSARKQQTTYVGDLRGELAKKKALVEELVKTTAKERKDHQTLRDSTSRRFAHKIMGKREKYEAKESKEEREYVEALEREMTEKDNQRAIEGLLQEAEQVLADLTRKQELYESAQAELNALYNRIFDGPSEGFPEDDRLEYALMEATKVHDNIQQQLNAESRATELLSRAVQQMEMCQKNMNVALSYSQYDMWGGGTMADMMERNALRDAQVNASQVETLVDQAMHASRAVQPVGRVDIARGSIMSDVFFDNIFTDMAFHTRIKQSAAQVLLATNRLRQERDAAGSRANQAGQILNAAGDKLDRCRRELYNFRRATFESYAAQNPPPPDYDVVTSERNAAPKAGVSMPVPSAPVANPDIGESNTSHNHEPMPGPSGPSPLNWGSRNPFALALNENARKIST